MAEPPSDILSHAEKRAAELLRQLKAYEADLARDDDPAHAAGREAVSRAIDSARHLLQSIGSINKGPSEPL